MTQIFSGMAIARTALALAPIKRIGNVASAVIGATWAVLFLAHNVYFVIHDPDLRIAAKVKALIYG